MATKTAGVPTPGTIEIIDLLVKIRPKGQDRSSETLSDDPAPFWYCPFYQDSDLTVTCQEQLLDVFILMEELGELNRGGFERVIAEDGLDRNRATARFIAWACWLDEIMSSLDRLVSHEEDLNSKAKVDVIVKGEGSRESYDIAMYERAMTKMPIGVPCLRPSYHMYRIHHKSKLSAECKELQEDFYRLTVREIIEAFDQDVISPEQWKLQHACESKVVLDLGVDLSQNYHYRMNCSYDHYHHEDEAFIRPEGHDKDEDDLQMDSSWEDGREYRLKKNLHKARREKVLREKGWEYAQRFDPDPKYEKDEHYDVFDHLEAHTTPPNYFAIDPRGLQADEDMFFGFNVGQLERFNVGELERQRKWTAGASCVWENTRVFVVLKFNYQSGKSEGVFLINPCTLRKFKSCKIVQNLFAENEYARQIGHYFWDGPFKASMDTQGTYRSLYLSETLNTYRSLYLSETLNDNACKSYAVGSKIKSTGFISHDPDRMDLGYFGRIYKKDAAIPELTNYYYETRGLGRRVSDTDHYVINYVKETLGLSPEQSTNGSDGKHADDSDQSSDQSSNQSSDEHASQRSDEDSAEQWIVVDSP